jgi:methyl-accepting chemotaxis protein
MQQSVSANIGELHKLTEAIQERSKELDKAYQRASKADRMKTVFLHNMTNQMVDPAFSIDESVTMLKPDNKNTEKKSVNQLVENIQQNGNTITQLLNNLINLSEKEMSDEKGGEA